MLGRKSEHTADRDQLPAGLPHIRPHQLPGPLTLDARNTGPNSTEPGPESGILRSLLGSSHRPHAMRHEYEEHDEQQTQ